MIAVTQIGKYSNSLQTKPGLEPGLPGIQAAECDLEQISCLHPGLRFHYSAPRRLHWLVSEDLYAPQAAGQPGFLRGRVGRSLVFSKGNARIGARVPALSLHLTHLAARTAAGVAWAQARDQMQESGIVSAGRTERKNTGLPKSCEQVVGSGWVPRACSEPGWGRRVRFPSVHQGCEMTESPG